MRAHTGEGNPTHAQDRRGVSTSGLADGEQSFKKTFVKTISILYRLYLTILYQCYEHCYTPCGIYPDTCVKNPHMNPQTPSSSIKKYFKRKRTADSPDSDSDNHTCKKLDMSTPKDKNNQGGVQVNDTGEIEAKSLDSNEDIKDLQLVASQNNLKRSQDEFQRTISTKIENMEKKQDELTTTINKKFEKLESDLGEKMKIFFLFTSASNKGWRKMKVTKL